MFAPAFGRAVRSNSGISASQASSLRRAAFNTAHQPIRPVHQRRLSSSKPSIPPSNKKKPAEDLKQNAATPLQGTEADAKSYAKVPQVPQPDPTSNIPSVPPTTHLKEDYVKEESFFALHAPIPLYKQPTPSMEEVEAMLNPNKAKSIQQTRQTLSEFLQSLHANIDVQEEMQEQAVYVQQVDVQTGPPTEESIMAYVAKLNPFTPPPPPVAFDPFAGQETSGLQQYTSEVTVPFQQVEEPATFREHVRRRRGGMHLISVKRQRKLKMKKHKYKKLMKRTRLLRRKLDRT